MKKSILLTFIIMVMSACSIFAAEYACKDKNNVIYFISPNDTPKTYCMRKLGPDICEENLKPHQKFLVEGCLKEFETAKKLCNPKTCEKLSIINSQENGVKCTKMKWSDGTYSVCDDGKLHWESNEIHCKNGKCEPNFLPSL